VAISTFLFASKYCEFGAFLCKIHAAFSFWSPSGEIFPQKTEKELLI
jgi:hypothetical protein